MNTESSTGFSPTVTLKKGVRVLQREERGSEIIAEIDTRFQAGTKVTHGPVEMMVHYGEPVEAVPIIEPKIAIGIYLLVSELEAATK